MAEVQMKSQGCLQLCQLSFGCGQEWSNEGDRKGAAGRGCIPEPRSLLRHPQRGLAPQQAGLRKDRLLKSLQLYMAQQDWAHDLPSEERTLILPLISKLWQERPQIPSPYPKNCLHADDLWIASKKKKTNKTQLFNSRLLPIHITAKCNSLIYK